jgi:hypothetical protein
MLRRPAFLTATQEDRRLHPLVRKPDPHDRRGGGSVIAFLTGLVIGLGAGAFLACAAAILGFLRICDGHDVELEREYERGHARGIKDERAERLALALWEADNDSYGGSE